MTRLNDAGGTDRVNLLGAAQTLGIKGASTLAKRLGTALKVDEVIVAGDAQQLAIGAGVKVSDNLYLRYTYDVFSRLGGLLVSYKMTEGLSIQAKSGDAQSIRLLYQVDRE